MARINLLPWREERRKARQTQFTILAGMVAGASAFTVGVLYLAMNTAISIQTQRNDYLTQQIAFEDTQIAKIKSLQDTKQALVARMQVIQQLQSSRPIVVHLFDQLVKTLPPGVFLTGVRESGDNLTLDGVAESSARISTYLRNIDASPYLGNPNLVVAQKDSSKNGAQKFTITAKVMDKAALAAKAAADKAGGGA